jgi:hypothetical protein
LWIEEKGKNNSILKIAPKKENLKNEGSKEKRTFHRNNNNSIPFTHSKRAEKNV